MTTLKDDNLYFKERYTGLTMWNSITLSLPSSSSSSKKHRCDHGIVLSAVQTNTYTNILYFQNLQHEADIRNKNNIVMIYKAGKNIKFKDS